MKRLLPNALIVLFLSSSLWADNIKAPDKVHDTGSDEIKYEQTMEYFLGSATVEQLKSYALKGSTTAQYDLGIKYYEGSGVPKDYNEAAKWFQKAAERGDSRAQGCLGSMYSSGEGVQQDYVKAAEWFTKAAEQGDAVAQCILGGMYSNGKGVQKNDAKAIKLITKSAEQGYVGGQYSLGAMYYFGRGIPQNYVQAYMWWCLSAAQGDKEAMKSRDRLAKEMTADQITEAQKLASEWRPHK